jgi:hypothetical protein
MRHQKIMIKPGTLISKRHGILPKWSQKHGAPVVNIGFDIAENLFPGRCGWQTDQR